MAYLTYDNISAAAYQRVFSMNESFKFMSSNKKVFLSYRRKDEARIKSVVGFLIAQNVSIYVDYLDSTLPNPPDYTTAKILRERLKTCDKFILLATPNSKESYWMPWELGLGDGFTGYDNTIVGIWELLGRKGVL
jgi:hypothetical protein